MKIGAFSISLAVKDLNVSKVFYEKLGFVVFAGNIQDNYLIMKNDQTVIGLFQGMFEKNILTFNPGWDQDCRALSNFKDVRELCKEFNAKGLNPIQESFEKEKGPGSFNIIDPDGNLILFDQHI